ncbi:MAG TPA: four helix bundle protein [Vicinamibacterales bacterium]|nr:four helix bundle protein [Vicinamibacterales bacterium]
MIGKERDLDYAASRNFCLTVADGRENPRKIARHEHRLPLRMTSTFTAAFPRTEQYGITSQMRRAAVSIPANLAEGHCRRTSGAYAHHVSIALGSHGELETYIEVVARLGYLTTEQKAHSASSP